MFPVIVSVARNELDLQEQLELPEAALLFDSLCFNGTALVL